MIMKLFSQRFSTNKIKQTQSLAKIFQKVNEVSASQEQMQQQINNRIKQLQKRHRQTQQLIDSKIKFPLKLCGTNDKYQSRYSYLPQRVMSYYRIPNSRVTDYLLKMYKASLYAIADRNLSYMNEYWEQGLTKKVVQAIDKAKDSNYTIKVEQSANYLQQIEQSCEILDSVMIRGLSMIRAENNDPKQYHKYVENQQVGLLSYTPKYITDNNQNFIDPKKNKNVYSGYDKMLLRALVRIKSPLRLNITELNVPKDVYTWEHICIMQNQMAPMKPLQSSYKLETLMQWLGKYRFGPWRIVDIDNFMRGNSPFINHINVQEQIDPVFKGTKLDKSSYIDIRSI